MSSSDIILRGIPQHIIVLLEEDAKRLNISVNTFILKIIEGELGISSKRMRSSYHDLDHLAGSWTAADEEAFTKNTAGFRHVDKDF